MDGGDDTHDRLATLPFVTIFPDGIPDCWDVQATGNLVADMATGKHYAELMFKVMRESGDNAIIGVVMRDIFLSEEWTGLEIGFLEVVGEAAYRWSLH